MKDLIIPEAAFAATLQDTVRPYLDARKSECPLQRGPEQTLYCAHYRAEQAVGVVVLSHGFTESEEKYREPIYYFLQKGYHVYMADHCGHGRSYRLTQDPSLVHIDRWQRYVDDLLAVAEQAHRQYPALPLFLYGHSMGGGIAAAALAQAPQRFRRAVLSSPMIRPLTGGLPFPVAHAAAWALCRLGRAQSYVPGGRPYEDNETFEASAATCRERFESYRQKRSSEPLFQTNAASCGWLNEAARLSGWLLGKGSKRICTPLLLFQAEADAYVDTQAQQRFADRVNAAGHTTATLVRVPGTRHEIFNADSSTVAGYWQRIFDFLAQTTD